jgi:hypothetical protein
MSNSGNRPTRFVGLAKQRSKTMPRNSDGDEEIWRFAKKTPKRIYLRRGKCEEFWTIDGRSRGYRSRTIHPDDLAKILDGTIK